MATPLELLFDLVFVVAIAEAASGLHHAVATDHVADGLVGYVMVFFAIWWAWMAFTWFASAYDTDDVPYRLTVFVQITGALILAAGVPSMFETRELNLATVGGYVVMRLAMVVQWLRAAASDPPRRAAALRYAAGIAAVQLGWAAALAAPSSVRLAFPLFVTIEMLIPLWAERAAPTLWHPHHIAERYGLLTLIVFGESILSATTAVQSALAAGERLVSLIPIIVGGLLIVFSLWWLYFDRPAHARLTTMRRAFIWGYGHYLIFASAAAIGAGLGVAIDTATAHATIDTRAAGFAVAVPIAIFLISLWILHAGGRPRWPLPVAATLMIATPATGQAVFVSGALLAITTALLSVTARDGQLEKV